MADNQFDRKYSENQNCISTVYFDQNHIETVYKNFVKSPF